MEIGGFSFKHVCDIEPTREPSGSVVQVMPQDRYDNKNGLPLNRYGAGPFCKFTIPNTYRHSGVYVLAVDDQVQYVGECENLSSRFNAGYGNISPRNCFKRGQETNCRLNNLVYNAATRGARISLWFFPTEDYKAAEAALRASQKLAWNRI